MGFPYGETVVVTAGAEILDDYSNVIGYDFTDPDTVATVSGVGVEPRPSGEQFQNDRNAVVDGFTLYDPSNELAVVEPTHRITVRGSEWAVDGPPAVWRSPLTGWAPGVVVQVGRIDG